MKKLILSNLLKRYLELTIQSDTELNDRLIPDQMNLRIIQEKMDQILMIIEEIGLKNEFNTSWEIILEKYINSEKGL